MSDRLFIVYDKNDRKLQVTVNTSFLFDNPQTWTSFTDVVKCRREEGSNPIDLFSPNDSRYQDMVCYYVDDSNVRIAVLKFDAYSDSEWGRCNRNEGTGWIYPQGVRTPSYLTPGPAFWKQVQDWEL
jgi:hypothetical protein